MRSQALVACRENDEALMTNDEGSPNAQMTGGEWSFLRALGFRHSFVIRHSSFGIPFRSYCSAARNPPLLE